MKRCSLILVCLVLTGSNAIAQNFGQKDSLAGLKAISVVIDKIDSDAEAEGLRKDQIQTDVELQLRKAGVSIITPKSVNEINLPELYVQVSALKLKNSLAGVWTFSISIEVIQPVYLATNTSKLITGTTWATSTMGSVGTANIRQIRESVRDAVDQFLNDYLSVNPK